MKLFPDLCRLSEQQREGLKPAVRYAAMTGCPEKYFYLAEAEYATLETYRIHKFKDLQVRHVNGTTENFSAHDQWQKCQEVVESFFRPEGSLTVINGYPDLSEVYLFLWHLVGHFASIKFGNPVKHKDARFNFIGNFRLEEEHYSCAKIQNLGMGPALDEMNNFHVTSYVETLMRYDDLNKIILTSTTDVTALLERLRIIPGRVTTFFNLSAKPDDTKKTRKKKTEVI